MADTALPVLDLLNALLQRGCPQDIQCRYRNWKGEQAMRRIRLLEVRFGTSQWHPEPGYLVRGLDLDKMAERDFALADMDLATLSLVSF